VRGQSASVPSGPPRRRTRADERPPAPWGRFPLVELCVLAALVIGVAGFITGGRRGGVMLVTAASLGSLAGLELSVREHFAGYRSHTTVLAGAAAIVVMAVLFFTRVPHGIMLAVGVAIFGTAVYTLRELFKRRSGGFGFR
jgi:hypothetical protein